MRYERWKELTAIVSVFSILIGLSALTVFNYSYFYIVSLATATAAIAASVSIYISRRLTRERQKHRIFLIYVHEDVESARQIAQELKERDFSPWLDVDEVLPGDIWHKSVIRALEESAVALVLVSDNLTSNQGFVQEEIEVALKVLQGREKDKSPIIPVRLSETNVPDSLVNIHWVNIFEKDGFDLLERGLQKLLHE